MRPAIREKKKKVSATQKLCGSTKVPDSPSRILRSLNLSQNHANSAIFQIAADFALRRVFWRHRNAHSVKERLFLSSKNGMNSFAFSSCTIYKSYIGQTNRKRNKSALLVWATDRLSARTGAAGCSWSRDTVIHGAGRYSEVVEFTAESITSLSNLVRSIQIRHIIMLKLQISEQTLLMWKTGETLFNKHKSPPFTINLI